MSQVYNSFQELASDVLSEVNAELENTSVTTTELTQDDVVMTPVPAPEKRIHQTALQTRYRRQVAERTIEDKEVLNQLHNSIAWTWLPGKDRMTCPPVVDIRDARLLFMYYFWNDRVSDVNIGLSMYRTTVDKHGVACYAGARNYEMNKNFSLHPHFRASGQRLDSRNEIVFRNALALDDAMLLAASGVIETSNSFTPPDVLFGFSVNYQPQAEFRTPMHRELMSALHPNSPVLSCLQSPGGRVLGVTDSENGLRVVSLDRLGTKIDVEVPVFATLSSLVQVDTVIAQGQPLADLPRVEAVTMRDILAKYPYSALQWIQNNILASKTELITVEEDVFDKQLMARKKVNNTYRCVPASLVQKQLGRTARVFLDCRSELGRLEHSYDVSNNDIWREDPHQMKVHVCTFPEYPSIDELQFDDMSADARCTWISDLASSPADAAWTREPNYNTAA